MTVYAFLAMIIILYVLCMIGYKKYKVLLWSGIFIAICIAGTIIILNNSQNNQIDGRLLSYEKDDEYSDFLVFSDPEGFEGFDGPYYYRMDNDTINDIMNYPEKYTPYYIKIEVTNTSDKKIYDIDAEPVDKYENLWIDTSSIYDRWSDDLEAHKTREYDDVLYVIVKTEGMTDKEIDKLIKSIKLKIHATNIEYLNSINREGFLWLYDTKVIGFDD